VDRNGVILGTLTLQELPIPILLSRRAAIVTAIQCSGRNHWRSNIPLQARSQGRIRRTGQGGRKTCIRVWSVLWVLRVLIEVLAIDAAIYSLILSYDRFCGSILFCGYICQNVRML
jgi:hypothetical protein